MKRISLYFSITSMITFTIDLIVKIFIYILILGTLLPVFATEYALLGLTLDDAIALALKHNLSLQSSQDRVSSANISLETAKSEFGIKIRPEVAGNFQKEDNIKQFYGLRLSKRLNHGGELSGLAKTRIDDELDELYRTDFTLAYTQPLLRGRGKLATTNSIDSAERNTRSQYYSLTLTQQQLIVNTASAYYSILRDQMLLEVNERAVERAKLLLQAAEAKLQVGMASKMDVFRAELQLLTAENRLIDAQTSLENSGRRFNLLLGSPLEVEYRLSSPLDYTPIMMDKEQLIQQAMEHRLEIQDARENVNDAERRLKIAKQNLYPPVDISIQFTLRGEGDDFDQSLDLDNDFWGIGLNTSFNLDFANERATYQQAQLALNSAIRALESTQENVMLEVLRTITSVRQAEASVHLQEQSVFQAEKQLELSGLRYKKGLSDNLDVVDAEENLNTAKTNYYSAIVQHLIAKMRLQQVSGTLDIPF